MAVQYLGAHMSIQGGVSKAIERGRSIGCTAIQIFTKNQRNWRDKEIPADEAARFRAAAAEFGPPEAVIAHDSYLVNLGAPADETWEKSVAALADEIGRCELLGVPLLVMHPGAPLAQGEEWGLDRIARGLDRVFSAAPRSPVTVLLETTAGQGSNLGFRFEQLAEMIRRCDHPDRLGVCFDTCHVFAAGYDLRTTEGFQRTMAELDRTVGIDRLKAFHLNDSKKDIGSRVDRHEHIGQGALGIEPFRALVNDKRFAKIPMILETPKEEDMAEDVENLARLRALMK